MPSATRLGRACDFTAGSNEDRRKVGVLLGNERIRARGCVWKMRRWRSWRFRLLQLQMLDIHVLEHVVALVYLFLSLRSCAVAWQAISLSHHLEQAFDDFQYNVFFIHFCEGRHIRMIVNCGFPPGVKLTVRQSDPRTQITCLLLQGYLVLSTVCGGAFQCFTILRGRNDCSLVNFICLFGFRSFALSKFQ